MDVRRSPIAGRWYPADPKTLARDVDRYLAEARPPALPGTVWGVVAPHAGLRYSGPVAAWAFACLRGLQPEVVAVVGPLHELDRARVLASAHDAYATPLGRVSVDAAARRRLDHELRERLGDGLAAVRNDAEHALEIELPFLQRVLGPFQLLPVMIRDWRAETAEALGQALASALRGRRALLVASSDLSHYYPRVVARSLDAELLDQLAAFDPAGVLEAAWRVERGACGAAAIAAVLWAARELGANRASVLRYGTSGDITGDDEAVVGYGAAAIWQQPEETDIANHSVGCVKREA